MIIFLMLIGLMRVLTFVEILKPKSSAVPVSRISFRDGGDIYLKIFFLILFLVLILVTKYSVDIIHFLEVNTYLYG